MSTTSLKQRLRVHAEKVSERLRKEYPDVRDFVDDVADTFDLDPWDVDWFLFPDGAIDAAAANAEFPDGTKLEVKGQQVWPPPPRKSQDNPG